MAIDRLTGDDDNKKLLLKQIAFGSVTGFITGYASMKVGKVAATAIGGGLILLQVANTKGYININWNRLSNDVDKVKSRLQEEAGKKTDWTEKLEQKTKSEVNKLVSKNRRWFHSIIDADNDDRIIKDIAVQTVSFVLGFGVGVLSGN